MKLADFELYKDLLYQKSGLVVTQDKAYLLDSRLTPIAKKWNMASIDEMTLKLRALPDPDMVKDIIEAMTTNETSFFRDIKPFQLFEQHMLPVMADARKMKKSIRIWCAAASSGQEPYTLAMILKEKEHLWKGYRIEIIATDISDEILETARRGIYSQFEVQRGLPIQYLMKYFTQMGEKWQLKDDIRNMVRFSNFNLLDSMTKLGRFDIIFCRNVLIYFDEKTKSGVFDKMAGILENDGMLVLGGAETVMGITTKFKPVTDKRGLYSHSAYNPPAGAGSAPAQPAVAPTVSSAAIAATLASINKKV